MQLRFYSYWMIFTLSLWSLAQSQTVTKLPSGVILVKGAWSSASDSVTPVPEGGTITGGVFRDRYFGITYALPADWTEKYKGPPPSDTGRYVLAQLSPGNTFKGAAKGSILIAAQDLFFTTAPAASAAELIGYMKDNLQSEYQVETPPKPLQIAGRSFTFFTYSSPAAQLHWYVLATEIRCHAVQLVLTSRDTKLLESLVLSLNRMNQESDGGTVPVCISNYASPENVLARVDPIFTERRFNPVPIRIIIDKQGKVKHIHFLSAFPDQSKAITDALAQWKFKPFRKDGHPAEVETGILFGRPNVR